MASLQSEQDCAEEAASCPRSPWKRGLVELVVRELDKGARSGMLELAGPGHVAQGAFRTPV